MATTKIQSGAFPADVVTTAAIDDASVTHAKLHTDMDLSSKTVTLPTGASLGSNTAGVFDVKGGSSTSPQVRFFDGGTARARVGVPTGQTYLSLSGSDTLTADMAIDASGRVGIKNTTMSSFNQVGGADLLVIGSGAGDQGMTIYTGNTGTGSILFADGTTTSNQYEGYVQYVHSDNRMLFGTNHDTRMTISQTGKVGIGAGSPSNDLHVQQSSDDTNGGIQVRNSADASGMFMYVDASNHGHIDMGSAGNLEFRTGSTDRMFIKQAGRVSVGSLNNQLYGLFQVNQTSDLDEDGIGILNSTGVRSMRVYVNSDDRSVINSGNGGGQGLVLNEGGGQVNFGSNSTANNGHVQISYGTTVSDPPTLTINATSQSTTAPGDVYGQIVFRVNGAAGVSASGLANTDEDSIAMITAQDWRDGSGKTNEDSGIGFYTSNSSGTLTFRGGFANNGHFGIGTRNNNAALQRLLSLSDPDPSIYAIDTDNNAYNEIIMQDGQMDYRADQGNTQGSSCHVWRVDGTQVAYLNADGMRFGNTTSGANALDDYEEGTFDVTLSDGTNTDTKTFKYVKIGRCVNITGITGSVQYWVLSASGGAGAGTDLTLTGSLPFTPADIGGIVSAQQRALRTRGGTDFGASGIMPVLGWRDGSTTMYLDHTGREHSYEPDNDCERDSTRTNIVFQVNGWYYTNS